MMIPRQLECLNLLFSDTFLVPGNGGEFRDPVKAVPMDTCTCCLSKSTGDIHVIWHEVHYVF